MENTSDHATPQRGEGKSVPLEEVEALLAAERERCAKVAEVPDAWTPFWHGQPPPEAIATAIRSLAPQTIGDEG